MVDTPYSEISTLDYKLYDYLIEIRNELETIKVDMDALSKAFSELRQQIMVKKR